MLERGKMDRSEAKEKSMQALTENTVRKFFEQIFSKNSEDTAYLELRAFNTNKKPVSKFYEYPKQLDLFLDESRAVNKKLCVYFGIGLKKEERGTKEATYDNLSIIPLDIDILKDCLDYKDKTKYPETPDEKDLNQLSDSEAFSIVKRYFNSIYLPLEPSWVFYTGHGVQVYYVLNESITEEKLKEFKKVIEFDNVNKGFINADSNIYDLARVLRIPGSNNKKFQEKQGRILSHKNNVYSFDQILNEFKSHVQFKEQVKSENIEETTYEANSEINWDYVPPCVKKALELRKTGSANREIQLFLRAFFMRYFNQDSGNDARKTLEIFKKYSNNFNEELTLKSLEEWFKTRRAPSNCANSPAELKESCKNCSIVNIKRGNPLKSYFLTKRENEEVTAEQLEEQLEEKQVLIKRVGGASIINKTWEKELANSTMIMSKNIGSYSKPHINHVQYFNLEDFEYNKELVLNKKVIDILDEEHAFLDFVNTVKTKNVTWEDFAEDYYLTYQHIVKKYDKNQKIKRSKAYGFFGENYSILGNDWELDSKYVCHGKAKKLRELFDLKYEMGEIEDLIYHLDQYLQDDLGKWILEYSMASLFRYYLMDTKKLDMFPNLVITGQLGTGKSARIKLLFAKMFLNLDILNSKKVAGGTGIRLENEQYCNLPLIIDEAEIPEQMYDILKILGTSKRTEDSRYNISTRIENSLIRPLMVSANSIRIEDPALVDRCVIIDVDDLALVNTEDEHRYLIDKINKLGAFIYRNIDKFYEQLKTLDFKASRKNAKESIFYIGKELLKFLFESFGMKYNSSSENPVESYTHTSTLGKRIRKTIIDDIKRVIVTEEGVQYNIYDAVNNSVPGDAYNKLMNKLSAVGVFVKEDRKEGFIKLLLTNESKDHLNIDKLGIYSLRKLKNEEEFDYKEYKIDGKTKKALSMNLMPIEKDREIGFVRTDSENLDSDERIILELIKDEVEEKKSNVVSRAAVISRAMFRNYQEGAVEDKIKVMIDKGILTAFKDQKLMIA